MRKDVRIGLSIGGVLLAVLIVYLLVPKDSGTTNLNNSQVAKKDGSAHGGAGDLTGPTARGATSDTTGQQSSGNGGLGSGDATGGQRPEDSRVATGGTGTGANPGRDAASPTGTDPSSQANNSGGSEWASLLKDGIAPESMMATKDVFGDEPKNNPNGSGPAKGPQNTPSGPTIDWNNPGGSANGGAQTGGQAGVPAPGSGSTGAITGGARAPLPSIREHTVQLHETFSTIALAVYGDARYYKSIQKANPNVDERRLKPGMVIKLPDGASVKAAQAPVAGGSRPGTAVVAGAAARAEPAIDPSKEYRVQPSDSLQKIALKLYGKATKADALYELNKEKIGSDEHKIKVGMVLKLPEAPTLSPTATR